MKIALLGAESTGKSQLTQALVAHLQQQGQSAIAVDEYLRHWCDVQGRTPQPHEQAGIATEQKRRIETAAAQAAWVIADTTPLMTAIYSDYIFADTSLYAQALSYQRSFDLTLLTGLDLAWQADGLQRDGPQVREPVDALLRQHMQNASISYHIIYGQGAARLHHALRVIGSAQNATKKIATNADFLPASEQKSLPNEQNWSWHCEKCSDPECEHRLFRKLIPAC